MLETSAVDTPELPQSTKTGDTTASETPANVLETPAIPESTEADITIGSDNAVNESISTAALGTVLFGHCI